MVLLVEPKREKGTRRKYTDTLHGKSVFQLHSSPVVSLAVKDHDVIVMFCEVPGDLVPRSVRGDKCFLPLLILGRGNHKENYIRFRRIVSFLL